MFRLPGVDTGFVMCALSVVEHGTSPVEAEPFFGGGFRERLTVPRGSSAAEHGRDDMAVLSPELVLVCPELRELALQQLPESGPDCLRPRLRLVEPSEGEVVGFPPDRDSSADAQELSVIDGNPAEGLDPPLGDPPLVVSIVAYAIHESVSFAVRSAACIAVLSALLLLSVQIFH
jgi:hypothetical protein